MEKEWKGCDARGIIIALGITIIGNVGRIME